ncbi:MAG TPA: pilus assembly protein TadG-related protein [Streptosporangiaceae bacterium]|nr:pilus assembly protein TadG-related protein [Streptosporangiaceae bacterium]
MRSWRPSRRAQRGQAIVLIAVMLAVLVGMAALAIDGSRAYALRRDLQSSVDAAALAAADRFQQTDSYTSAEQAASTIFGTDARLYGAPACSPGYGAPGAVPFTVTCTYSDGTTLKDVVSDLGPQGGQFTFTATRTLALQFARILTSGTAPKIVATSSGGVNNLRDSPTLEALDSAGCGGVPGAAFSAPSGGTLTVVGDVVSNGSISLGSSTALVAGDVYARCQAAVPGVVLECYPSGSSTPCTYPDVAGATRSGYQAVDPVYPPPAVTGGSLPKPGNTVVLSPGVYAADPTFGNGLCYFLSSGVYKWQGGYTNNGAFVSNELKPPDEPRISDNTKPAPHQFWDIDANCSGSAQVTSVAGAKGVPNGTWAFVLTSTRTTIYNGLPYVRESAPSECYTTFVNGAGRNVQIQVSNVPGATAYNIYAAPSGSCSGPFGLADVLAVVGTPQNNSTKGCPAVSGPGCSLGNESIVLDGSDLGAPFAPNPLALPGVTGSYPPSGETAPLKNNLANENPNRATPPAGDRANENQCDTVGGTLTTCPGAVTPGAVEYYLPSGSCINDTSSGDNNVFSGYQYNWMMVYEPGAGTPPANTCSNFLGAATDSAFVGLIYTPSAAITISKASTFRTDELGGLIADTITMTGQLPTVIGDPADYGPVPPAARLVS